MYNRKYNYVRAIIEENDIIYVEEIEIKNGELNNRKSFKSMIQSKYLLYKLLPDVPITSNIDKLKDEAIKEKI